MKTILASAVSGLMFTLVAVGQSDFPTNAPTPAPLATVGQSDLRQSSPTNAQNEVRDADRFQSETLSRILGLEMKTYGVIPQALGARNPLQLINPFAPPEYGDGTQNTSLNPETGRANGIIVFGLRF